MQRKKTNKPKKNNKKILYSEIGHFVVVFEKLQKAVKQLIVDCFEHEDLKDISLIEIVLYQASSFELTEIFRGITYHEISKMEKKYISKEEKRRIEILKNYISKANKNLAEVAKLRNDLLHASYDESISFDWNDDWTEGKTITHFQGRRPKIRSKGIELDQINLAPNIFENVIEKITVLETLVHMIDLIINHDLFQKFDFNDQMTKVFSGIDIEQERTKLFDVKKDHYLKQSIFKKDMEARKENLDSLEDHN